MEQRVRLGATAGVVILGLFIAQFAGFFVLGEGFAFGAGGSNGPGLVWSRFDPKIVLGAGLMHLKTGQGVDIHYKAEVGGGTCVRAYLARLPGIGPFSNNLEVDSSGAGDAVLTVPTEGWYRMMIYGANPAFCASAADRGGGAVRYSLTWKVQAP